MWPLISLLLSFWLRLSRMLETLKINYKLQDGGVFTFGAGNYGQLGHNTKQNEVLPKKVFELMGSPVTQIACGRLVRGFIRVG